MFVLTIKDPATATHRERYFYTKSGARAWVAKSTMTDLEWTELRSHQYACNRETGIAYLIQGMQFEDDPQ